MGKEEELLLLYLHIYELILEKKRKRGIKTFIKQAYRVALIHTYLYLKIAAGYRHQL